MKLLRRLSKQTKLSLPPFLLDNVMYATYMGSVAYGVADLGSDVDIYGFCIPPKELIFPHLGGEIPGFGAQIQRFEQWHQHHIKDTSANKEYDFSIFSIVKYFQLCMENNPNMIDSLFVPRTCIVTSTAVSELVRENRKLFLHKGAYHKFKGYAYSQMHKMDIKNPEGLEALKAFEKKLVIPFGVTIEEVENALINNEGTRLWYLSKESLEEYHDLFQKIGKRAEDIRLHGYDTKFAYHIVRLLSECEQILVEHDLNLQKNNEQLKSIRRGEWTLKQVKEYFENKEKQLEEMYGKSTLQYKPEEDKIKKLLLECLEMHYGSLEKAVYVAPDIEADIKRVLDILNKYQ